MKKSGRSPWAVKLALACIMAFLVGYACRSWQAESPAGRPGGCHPRDGFTFIQPPLDGIIVVPVYQPPNRTKKSGDYM